MKNYDIYITLIFIVKVIFLFLAVYNLYTKSKNPKDTKLLERIKYWKSRFEFIFITLMSALLIYLFNPRTNNIGAIDSETKLLLYLFGFILILSESWNIFIHESPIFIYLKSNY